VAIQFPEASWSRGYGWYCEAYPTHYKLRGDVRDLVLKYLNHSLLAGRISANTYHLHPPAIPRETTSVDFWAWWGRGGPLTDQLRRETFDILFYDSQPPYIAWVISGGGMWTPSTGWTDAPYGPVGSDPGHFNHIHVTYS
jgi:hypothetical protein